MTTRLTRVGLIAVVIAMALASTGCGMSLPGLGGHTAKPAAAPRAAAVDGKDSRKRTADKSAKNSPKSSPHTPSPREQLDDARAHAASAPTHPYWPYRMGELYAATDSAAAAEAALQQALARDHTYAPALSLLSKQYYDSGRHADAIEMLEAARVVAQRGSSDLAPELLAGLALHYDAIGQAAPAHAALAAIPRVAHRATEAAAAAVALHDARSDTANDLAAAAVRDHPNSAACQNNYGIARLRAGDPKAARAAFEKAIELDPHRPGPFYNLAILEKYYALDDAAAARWFERYRAIATDDPDGLADVFANPPAKPVAEGSKP